MNTIDQSSNLGDALRRPSTTPTAAERRLIERERIRRKRLDPVYVAKERAANAARMRERRERLRCMARRRGAIGEARP
jgi:hypothetical protein